MGDQLPTINAFLNGACTCLLVAGYVAIKRRQVTVHKACMIAALGVSAVFLASYLYYHIVVRKGENTTFGGSSEARIVYLVILISHMILAALTAPLALITGYLGWRERLDRHVRLARWTLPIWLYVSVTGVVVYLMLRPYYTVSKGG